MKTLLFILLFPVSLFGQYYPMTKLIIFYPTTKDSNTFPVTNLIQVTDSAVYILGDSTKTVIFECDFKLPVGEEILEWVDGEQKVRVSRDKIGYKYTVKRKEEWLYFWTTFEEDLSQLNGL